MKLGLYTAAAASFHPTAFKAKIKQLQDTKSFHALCASPRLSPPSSSAVLSAPHASKALSTILISSSSMACPPVAAAAAFRCHSFVSGETRAATRAQKSFNAPSPSPRLGPPSSSLLVSAPSASKASSTILKPPFNWPVQRYAAAVASFCRHSFV